MAKSKFFRVAVEGGTTDGRAITRDWLEQMAQRYNQSTYGARVNLEHIRGTDPNGLFKMYGDITAAKTEEVDMEGEKRLALFVQIDPTPELIDLNKKRQKVYTSVEIHPNLNEKGAYLMGLAITDSPASLGTDMLQFCAGAGDKSPLKTDYDTTIGYAQLDAWAKFPDFQTRIRDAIVTRQGLDRIMVGFNGTSAAPNTDRNANPLLQDVNIGWLEPPAPSGRRSLYLTCAKPSGWMAPSPPRASPMP